MQGLQTFLTMLGSTVMIPLLLVPAMGGTTQGKPARLRLPARDGAPPAAATATNCTSSFTPGLKVPHLNDNHPNHLITTTATIANRVLLFLPADKADVVCTCFFASGINTLLQTLLGARLPIVQVSGLLGRAGRPCASDGLRCCGLWVDGDALRVNRQQHISAALAARSPFLPPAPSPRPLTDL